MDKKINKKQFFIKLFISIVILIAIVIFAYLILDHFNITSLSQEKVQEIVSSYGIWGPLVFIILSFLQVTLLPIPGAVTIIAGNFLFNPFLSFLYSFIGIFLGSIVSFILGRKLGRKFVNWIVGDKEIVDYYLNKLKGRETIILFFMFLLPLFPDDALCAIAGILPITFPVFIFIQIVTRCTSIAGTLFFMSGEIIPYHGWGLIVLVVIAILSIVAFIFSYKNADKINEALIKTIDKIFKKSKN